MTEAQDARERNVKALGYVAGALALTWALSVTLCWLFGVTLPSLACGASFGETDPAFGLPAWLVAATVVLAPWLAAPVPWRWPRAGAVVVLFLSVLVPFAHLKLSVWVYPTWSVEPPMSYTCLGNALVFCLPCILLTMLPGLLAAFLLFATWWKSRTPAVPEATE